MASLAQAGGGLFSAILLLGLPAWLALRGNQLLAWTVTGKLRWYAASMGIGAGLVLALLLLG